MEVHTDGTLFIRLALILLLNWCYFRKPWALHCSDECFIWYTFSFSKPWMYIDDQCSINSRAPFIHIKPAQKPMKPKKMNLRSSSLGGLNDCAHKVFTRRREKTWGMIFAEFTRRSKWLKIFHRQPFTMFVKFLWTKKTQNWEHL